MTLSVVSLLGANVDEAAEDLATFLTAEGTAASFESAPPSRRMELVRTGGADIVWLCGWLALEIDPSPYDLIATPSFTGEEPASYRSVVISRAPSAGMAELSAFGAVWAMNEPGSWSGRLAVLAECDLRGLTPPSNIVWSGSHVESIRMVADGAADAAAIDSTLWRWARGAEPRVVDLTRSWPAPPILIRRDLRMRSPALSALVAAATGLRGVDHLQPADWDHLDPLRERTGP